MKFFIRPSTFYEKRVQGDDCGFCLHDGAPNVEGIIRQTAYMNGSVSPAAIMYSLCERSKVTCQSDLPSAALGLEKSLCMAGYKKAR